MGQQIDLECGECGLKGADLSLGAGRDLSRGPFESRVFWCPKCAQLGDAVVLSPVDDVRELLKGIESRGHSWAGAPERVEMSYQEFVEALIRAHRWPRCVCGGRYRAVRIVESDAERLHACPAGAAKASRATTLTHWD